MRRRVSIRVKTSSGRSKRSHAYVKRSRRTRKHKTGRRRLRPEVKQSSATLTPTSFNSSINPAVGDFYSILPAIVQGTAKNQRVGSRVHPVKLVVRGYIVYNLDTQINARMLLLRMFCVEDKRLKSLGTGTTSGNLIEFGGTPVTYDGSVTRHLAPPNKDGFRIFKDKRMTMKKPYGYTATSTNGAQANQAGSLLEIDSSLFRPFTIVLRPGKHLPRTMTYDEAESASYPNNSNPVVAIGYTDVFNAPADTTTTQITMSWCTTLYYTDT